MIEIPSIPNYPNYQIDLTVEAEMKYDYKNSEKPLFNKILSNLSKIFGGLEYHEMKVDLNDMNYISTSPDIDKSKHDQFEYQITNSMVDLNERGRDGWEMVTIVSNYENSKEIIWKRKI